MSQVVSECAKKFGWKQKIQIPNSNSQIAHGVGFACALKNIGFSFGYQENAWAKVEIYGSAEIDKVIVYHGAAEVGQGTHTALGQMVASTLGVSMDKIELRMSDTATSESSGSVSASRMTYMGGNAIKGAAERALKKWQDEERPAIAEYKYLAPQTTNFDPVDGKSKPNVAYGYVAQAVEVEVDMRTGQVQVLKVLSAHDVGRAINRQQVEGQIEGALAQALGYSLMEHFQVRAGRVVTSGFSSYLLPTILDTPPSMLPIILELHDPEGPFGARGVAELPLVPFAAAVAAAIHTATGAWVSDLPFTPERVLTAIRAQGAVR